MGRRRPRVGPGRSVVLFCHTCLVKGSHSNCRRKSRQLARRFLFDLRTVRTIFRNKGKENFQFLQIFLTNPKGRNVSPLSHRILPGGLQGFVPVGHVIRVARQQRRRCSLTTRRPSFPGDARRLGSGCRHCQCPRTHRFIGKFPLSNSRIGREFQTSGFRYRRKDWGKSPTPSIGVPPKATNWRYRSEEPASLPLKHPSYAGSSPQVGIASPQTLTVNLPPPSLEG